MTQYKAGKAVVIQHDAANLPLPDGSVDLIVTSPPYFSLRDYKDGDASLTGQVGAEATPQEFLESLWRCSREWWRVLADHGSLIVNLGDKYGKNKSLLALPWRYALGMADGEGDLSGQGWVLRQEIIWSKKNPIPESVRDRAARKHEQIYHFTKQAKYYANVDEIREPYAEATSNHYSKHTYGKNKYAAVTSSPAAGDGKEGFTLKQNPKGRLPGTVWEIANEPLKTPDEFTDHYAAFPTEIPRRAILGWSAEGSVVLDPFGGTGTTAAVAKALGRIGVSSDLSSGYNAVAQWRTNGDGYKKVERKVRR